MSKQNLQVRIYLPSKEAVEDFKKAETLLIMMGEEFSEVIDFKVKSIIAANGYLLEGRNIVESEFLTGYAIREKKVEISRFDLRALREKSWTDGEEYFSTKTAGRGFRYDFDKCKPAIDELCASKTFSAVPDNRFMTEFEKGE